MSNPPDSVTHSRLFEAEPSYQVADDEIRYRIHWLKPLLPAAQ